MPTSRSTRAIARIRSRELQLAATRPPRVSRKPAAPNGAIIYEGPSMLDGAPIVVIATGLRGKSRNAKTGSMVQTWILRSDVAPLAAIRAGDDASICGSCRHRGDGTGKQRSCYVRVGQAPTAVFKAYKRGIYPRITDMPAIAFLGSSRVVRLGAYGDPGAAPIGVWRALVGSAIAHTGYTHQWRTIDPGFATLVMASADTPLERLLARARGYRVFRVRTEREPVEDREVVCPASAEAGKRTNCAACRACGGTSSRAKADIVIKAHGSGRTTFNILATRLAA